MIVEGFTRFDIVQINSAHGTKDMIGLDAIDHLELTNKRGESVTKPILGVEVDKLRKLNPAILKLWNIRFEKSTNVNFQCKKEVANLDATVLLIQPWQWSADVQWMKMKLSQRGRKESCINAATV